MKKIISLFIVTAFILGCSQGVTRVSIEGTVTLDGKPVSDAYVMIRPEVGPDASGKTDANGKFVIPKNEGPMVGNVQIMVEKTIETEQLGSDGKTSKTLVPDLPPDIQSKSKPFTLKSGNNEINIKLEEWR
ncbi:MAG: DUF4198 domain-containing protein [Planctomycetaceae bacterium]|jgi:hypothetical protein|nr:DUF4198 domain-containing protein [Planctomycetaceae bacterium]